MRTFTPREVVLLNVFIYINAKDCITCSLFVLTSFHLAYLLTSFLKINTALSKTSEISDQSEISLHMYICTTPMLGYYVLNVTLFYAFIVLFVFQQYNINNFDLNYMAFQSYDYVRT